MRKKAVRLAALAMAAVMSLSACGGGSSQGTGGGAADGGTGETSTSAIKDLVTYEAPNREQASFFVLNTEKANDLNVLCNLYSPLVEVDNMGKLQPAVAKEWGTEDGGLTWTFMYRPGLDHSYGVGAELPQEQRKQYFHASGTDQGR